MIVISPCVAYAASFEKPEPLPDSRLCTVYTQIAGKTQRLILKKVQFPAGKQESRLRETLKAAPAGNPGQKGAGICSAALMVSQM